ncbi:MAG: type II toxin-antitoxin system RelE/ParE family toxin [Planctomycetaceae bacterium]|nr:type II toxin-antitoxin system RelE/ParE family toxin [Planctomycetaceae bacterium]
MTWNLEVRPAAAKDILDVFEWYESEREGLGHDFVQSVEETLERIRESPEGPALIYRDIRVRTTHRFPYGVYYRLREDTIRIMAVVHLHRSSAAWKSRAD